jgi:hypothetical protein
LGRRTHRPADWKNRAADLICPGPGPLTTAAEEKAIIIRSFDLRINEKSRNINQTYANVFPS